MPKDSIYLRQKGFLDVGDGHSLYFEDWGNPEATPIFHLHGGPGDEFNEKHKFLYDPKRHRVIFHDQRGAGKSTPFGSLEHNTTQDLVADIEKLRIHLGIETLQLSGGSWGSALSLFYAIAHPERVERIMIWALFLARQSEVDFVNEGYPRMFFPEAWKRFIALVPEEYQGNGNAIMAWYETQVQSVDLEIAKKHADEWALWNFTLQSIRYNPARIEKETFESDNRAHALTEMHYFLEGCFVPENYILDNIDKIAHIPCTAIHGRFDMCTPPYAADDLAAVYGRKLNMIWVNSGHSMGDPEMNAALRATASTFLM